MGSQPRQYLRRVGLRSGQEELFHLMLCQDSKQFTPLHFSLELLLELDNMLGSGALQIARPIFLEIVELNPNLSFPILK